jgi:XRE family transcriptional regulator, aerobic/anaerobic benzoate catabolism transcriptional regulator
MSQTGIIMHAVIKHGLVSKSALLQRASRANGDGAVANGLRGAKISDDRYLKMLGERVRDARARHGMSRRMLAHDSGISERYLAELESGRGNFSIVLMRRLAKAIDVPVAELVSDETPRPLEHRLLVERIGRLDAAELAEASAILTKRFGDSIGRTERIALIGLRGAGKTTLGVLLAKQLGWEFIEMSREIEAEASVSVEEIFDLWGQAAYRRYERRALDRIIKTRSRVVLATGGGLVSEPATFERLLDSFYTIWLQASPEEHWDRVIEQGDRRVEGSGDSEALVDMRRILAQREALYRKADSQLDTSGKTSRRSLKELLSVARTRHMHYSAATAKTGVTLPKTE